MKNFSMGLALSLIKAAVLTIIVLGAMASLTSCERVADRDNKGYSNEWRATVLKTGRHITVKNLDSLFVMSGDTVTVFLMDTPGNKPYYYINNSPEKACDTMSMEMYVDGKDTLYEPFEAWNVRLEKRIAR